MPGLFFKSIEELKGIGKKRVEQFRRLGVNSVGDLLMYYPRDYEDWSDPIPIAEAPLDETVCIKATLRTPMRVGMTSKRGMLISKASVEDESGWVKIIYFNNKYISSMLQAGETYLFFGKINRTDSGLQMISPVFSKPEDGGNIHPIYHLTTGLPNRIVANAVSEALTMLPKKINDPLPQWIRDRWNLQGLDFAIRKIHYPDNADELFMAKRRLVFEELLVLNLGLRYLKSSSRAENGIVFEKDYTADFLSLLPFKFTNAQSRAVRDCINDMTKTKYPMNRLVQGDVGSGKTAVAAAVCYTAIKNGCQAAFMVPTEILAQQHYKSMTSILKDTGIRVELLTGSLTPKNKRLIRENLQSGEIDLVIGTHALLTDDTEFKNLALAITDEQHRFGVSQRATLLSKGNHPHLLVMSATPIPRTLALIIYGDLDISIIDELPPGRQKIDTLVIDTKKRTRALSFIRKNIDEGRQCYIVCPLVEEGENSPEGLLSAEDYAQQLMLNEDMRDIPIGILHGKMKPADKEAVMTDFKNGDIKLLVSTTVIEVGVDVPNANIIMIENADRFGLSQLHQLRGRVGRGSEKSYCILVSDNNSPDASRRLKTMKNMSNGFKIADEDLKLRGPGDFFGQKQHGLPELKIAGFGNTEDIKETQQCTEEILKASPDLSSPDLKGLKAEIKRLFSKTGDTALN